MKVEVAVLGPPVPNSPYGLCGRQATLSSNSAEKETQQVEICSGPSPRFSLQRLWSMDTALYDLALRCYGPGMTLRHSVFGRKNPRTNSVVNETEHWLIPRPKIVELSEALK